MRAAWYESASCILHPARIRFISTRLDTTGTVAALIKLMRSFGAEKVAAKASGNWPSYFHASHVDLGDQSARLTEGVAAIASHESSTTSTTRAITPLNEEPCGRSTEIVVSKPQRWRRKIDSTDEI